jgi:hypothetical protein
MNTNSPIPIFYWLQTSFLALDAQPWGAGIRRKGPGHHVDVNRLAGIENVFGFNILLAQQLLVSFPRFWAWPRTWMMSFSEESSRVTARQLGTNRCVANGFTSESRRLYPSFRGQSTQLRNSTNVSSFPVLSRCMGKQQHFRVLISRLQRVWSCPSRKIRHGDRSLAHGDLRLWMISMHVMRPPSLPLLLHYVEPR